MAKAAASNPNPGIKLLLKAVRQRPANEPRQTYTKLQKALERIRRKYQEMDRTALV
jgi:hypothetical protein